jgi:hypothetical protein
MRARSGGADAVCRAVLTLAEGGPGPAGVEGWSDDRTVVVLNVGHEADQP